MVINVWQETRITFLRRMANTVTPSQITEGLMRWPLQMLAAISLDQEDCGMPNRSFTSHQCHSPAFAASKAFSPAVASGSSAWCSKEEHITFVVSPPSQTPGCCPRYSKQVMQTLKSLCTAPCPLGMCSNFLSAAVEEHDDRKKHDRRTVHLALTQFTLLL